MKIAILHLTMGLSNRGSEKSLSLYANYLSQYHEVVVFQAGPASGRVEYEVVKVEGIEKAPSSAPVNLYQKLLFRLGLDENSTLVNLFTISCLTKLRDFRPDLIIPVNGAKQQRILKRQLSSVPQLVFGSAGIGYHDLNALKEKPAAFIALSPTAFEWAKSNEPDAVVKMLPNPLELKDYKSCAQAKRGVLPAVLTVGALTKYKQIDLVVKAVAKTPFSLLVVGDGEEKANLMKLAQSLMPGRYNFTSVTPQQMPDLYSSAQLFCFLPKPQEAFGNVLIEAMASGLPIITSDDPVRRSIVGENGFFADPADSKSIADLLIQAAKLTPIDYGDLLSRYSIHRVGPELERIINEIT